MFVLLIYQQRSTYFGVSMRTLDLKKTFIELERQIQFVPCLCSLPFLFFLFVVNGLLFAGMLELAHNDLVRR